MKSQSKILIAFLLNFLFSLFELFGGIFTGSVAILSDAVHDFGDALSIGLSWVLEKKAQKKPDNIYTYGYGRYSLLGAFIANSVLIFGSMFVLKSSIERIINPIDVNYNGMIVFAVIGLGVNLAAALITKDGESLNQKAINLHMLEDVLGWAVVLAGGVLMKFTNLSIIDPIMSLAVSAFILYNAGKGIRKIALVFLEKTPSGVADAEDVKAELEKLDGVFDVHHIHLRSFDGKANVATMHIVSDTENYTELKKEIKEKLSELKIKHSTLEFESRSEECADRHCTMENHSYRHCHEHSHNH